MLLEDAVDRALDRLHQTDPEYATARTDGLSNHGPMVVASLAEVGRFDRIAPFVDAYLPRLRPLPVSTGAAPRLGDATTRRAWIDHYEPGLLAADDWRPIMRDALRELAPGAIAAAAHGWLRTAHAVHMLAARDTPTRRRELAHGLASWAARFERLPGEPGRRPSRGVDVATALARVPIVPASRRSDAPLILDQVAVVRDLAGFAEAIETVDLEALPFDAALSALAGACARLFLAAPHEEFVYLHTITATSAVRLVAGALDEEGARALLGSVFQAVAALHATHAESDTSVQQVEDRDATREEILARAMATLDDHQVKLAAAALREDARTPQPKVMAAAARWLRS